jgi:acyl-CoA synthetase (AMP-forming)/AMP-acid ligase II
VLGGTITAGYRPHAGAHTRWKACRRFGGTLVGPWLPTGDLSFFCDGELFIMGRIQVLLIVYGRNHSSNDIEGHRARSHDYQRQGQESVCRAVPTRPVRPLNT